MILRSPTFLLALVLLASRPAAFASAEPVAPGQGTQAAGSLQAPVLMHMSYTGRAIGLDVMAVNAVLTLDAEGYRIGLSFRTAGLLSLFARSEQHSSVFGIWRGSQPEPLRFTASGMLRGAQRETLMDYRNGAPVVIRLVPPAESEREEVPQQARGGTVDTLSAVAFLIRRVADTGGCDGHTRVFDGRRLTEISARTVGQVIPARGETGAYEGEALRCDFTGQQLAGFMLDDSVWQRRPHVGSAWLGRAVPGGPRVPVRLTFETRYVGAITLILSEAGPGQPPAEPR